MAMLANEGECDYTSLKKKLEIADGQMSTHMKELLSCDYVQMEKTFVDNKPRTTYKITKEGRKKFAEYISALKKLIAMG